MDSVFKATEKRIDPLGRTISGFQPFQQAGFGIGAEQLGFSFDPSTGAVTRTGDAVFEPAMAKGQQTAELGIPALAAAQQQFDPATSNYQDFFNKYQADVTQEALKQIDQEAQQARNRLAGEATRAGVFGGSRFGVQQAELDKNIQDIKSKRIFEDLSKNFLQAQQASIGTSEAARGRQLQAAPVYGQLGQGIGQLGAQQFGLGQQGIGSLLSAGQTERTRQQAIEDELFRFKTTAAQEPRTRLGFTADILAGVPSIQQTVTQQPIPYTNPLAAAVGGGLAGLGGLGAFYSQ
jgi:hypothetical protein